TRLINEKLGELASAARAHSGPIVQTVGGSIPEPGVRARVADAAAVSGNRVTLLSVAEVPGGPQLTLQADSSRMTADLRRTFPAAYRAIRTGRLSSGTETASGAIAEAAYPVFYQGRVAKVIVYSAGVSDIVHTVTLVRHEILVAGGIVL